jgi:hypothetical protein
VEVDCPSWVSSTGLFDLIQSPDWFCECPIWFCDTIPPNTSDIYITNHAIDAHQVSFDNDYILYIAAVLRRMISVSDMFVLRHTSGGSCDEWLLKVGDFKYNGL